MKPKTKTMPKWECMLLVNLKYLIISCFVTMAPRFSFLSKTPKIAYKHGFSLLFFLLFLLFLFFFYYFFFLATASVKRVAIASVMRHPADLPRWLAHHRALGIARFVLRLEDADEVLLTYVRNQPDVMIQEVQNELGDQEDHYTTLMDRQKNFVNGLLTSERNGALQGIDWVLFIDDDEYLQGSLAWFTSSQDILSTTGTTTGFRTVKLQNVEAILSPSRTSSSSFAVQGYVRCTGNGKYKCRSYTNGKGGGQVVPGVSLMGPHDFGYEGVLGGATCYEMPFETLHLLHVESPTFLAWTDKYLRLQGAKDNGKDRCPFPWYHDSVKAVGDAYALYLRTVTHPLPQDQKEQKEGKEGNEEGKEDNYHRFGGLKS